MISKRTSRRLCTRLPPVFLLTAVCSGWTIAPSSSSPRLHTPSLLRLLSHLEDEEIDTLDILPYIDTVCPRTTTSDRRAWLHQCYTTAAAGVAACGGALTAVPALASAAATTTVTTTPAVCDATVTVWKRGEQRLLYLLGTAHISEVSAQLAGTLVDDVHPNAVFVELDLKRIQQVTGSSSSGIEPQRRVFDSPAEASTQETTTTESSSIPPPTPSNTTTRIIVPVAAEAANSADPQQQQQLTSSNNKNWFQRRVLNFATRAVGNALRGMYSNLNDAGFQPGEEFAAAMRQGRAVGASIVLGDQDVELTLRRLTEALAQTDLNQLMDPDAGYEKSLVELMPNGALEPEIKNYDDPAQYKAELAAYVEKLKSRESVRKIVTQLKEVAPALVEVMLTERDAYMARGIDTLNEFEVMVAVMGLAHQDGVEANLKERGWRQVRLSCPPTRAQLN